MKRTHIYLFLAAALTFIASCRKDDNPKIPTLTRVPIPLILKDASKDLSISAQDPTTFNASFTVDTYFKTDVLPKKFDVVVVKNGNKSNVKTIKADVSSYPTTIDITGQQLIDLFGEPIVLNDKFEFGADVTTQDGKTFLAFPPLGNGYGSGIGNQVGASTSVRYEAVCLFTAADYAGDFEVLVDEWQDYGVGTVIPVKVIDDTHISFQYATDNPKDIIVEVNTGSNETSVAAQIYGDYNAYGITNIMCETVEGSPDNYVAPCDGILSLKLHHFDATGNYGNAVIKLKKK
jgi:hypothetical protein